MVPALDSVLALLAMALPLIGSPGPAIFAVTANGAAFGVRASIPFRFGIYCRVFAVLCLTASGLTGLVFGGIFAGLVRSPRIERDFNVSMAILLLVSVALAAPPL